MPQGCFRLLEARKRQKKLFRFGFSHFVASRGQKWPPLRKHKKTTLKRIFLNTKRPYLATGGQKTTREDFRDKVFFLSFFASRGQNWPPLSENKQKNDFERIYLYLMLRGHIWPLVAGKRQIKLFSSPKKGFSGPQNKVFHVLNSENTNKPDFEKNFFGSNAKRSILASPGKRTAKERIFGSTE